MISQLKKVSIIVCGSYIQDISLDSTHHDYPFWTSTEDECLTSAVAILGLADWKRISKMWLDHDPSKTRYECQRRWETLRSQTPSLIVGKPHGTGFHINDNYKKSKSKLQSRSLMRRESASSLSVRKRKELEALAERRLFENPKSEIETQLVHRAYLLGRDDSRLEKILKMNAAEHQDAYNDDSVKISLDSIMIEMKKISSTDVEQSIKSTSKSMMKIPKVIAHLNHRDECGDYECSTLDEDRGIPPPSSDDEQNMMRAKSTTLHSSTQHQTVPRTRTVQLLNLDDTELPIHSAIESKLDHMRQKALENGDDNDDESSVCSSSPSSSSSNAQCLLSCSSPPLPSAFPCLADLDENVGLTATQQQGPRVFILPNSLFRKSKQCKDL